MQKMQILFGFDSRQFSDFSKGVVEYMHGSGVEVEAVVKLSKGAIRDYIRNNEECSTVVLAEVLNGKSRYTAEELAELTDDRDLNVIVVLNANHKGTEFMHTLYGAGITSALFQNGKKGGLTPRVASQYILHKRSRREAREYYGISDRKLELGFLGNDTFVEYYNALSDEGYGESLIERFVVVCGRMSQKQVADFIRRLDKEKKDELMKYEEFYVIVQLLKEFGIDLKIKKPKKGIMIGLATGEALLGVRESFENKPRSGSAKEAAVPDVGSPVKEIPLADTAAGGIKKASGGEFFSMFFADDESSVETEDEDMQDDEDGGADIKYYDFSSLFSVTESVTEEGRTDQDSGNPEGDDMDLTGSGEGIADKKKKTSAREKKKWRGIKAFSMAEKGKDGVEDDKTCQDASGEEEKPVEKKSQKKKKAVKEKKERPPREKIQIDGVLVALICVILVVAFGLVFALLIFTGIISIA